MSHKYHITFFAEQNAGPGQLHFESLTWDDLSDQLTTFETYDGDKSKCIHFNGVSFSQNRRLKEYAQEIHFITLDYDDGLSVDDAKSLFEEYQYIFYTSYNHQQKKGDKQTVDKFRIVIPLTKPCSAKQWEKIKHNLEAFAPGVDMNASAKLTQPFALPIVRTGQEGVSSVNEGKLLDVSDWEETELTANGHVPSTTPIRFSGELTLDTTIRRKDNTYFRIGDIPTRTREDSLYCPLHNDKKPGAYAFTSQYGNTYLDCPTCGRFKANPDFDPDDDRKAITNFIKKSKPNKSIVKPKKPPPIEEIVEMGNATAVYPFDRNERAKILKKKCQNLKKHTLLYAFEGFGKSRIVTEWAKNPFQSVVFGCHSNEQAAGQFKSFQEDNPNMKMQLIVSQEYQLKKNYSIGVIRDDEKNPWEEGDINEKKTIELIMKEKCCDEERAQEVWDECKPAFPRVFDNKIVVTTHARIGAWGRQQVDTGRMMIPKNAIIVFDDLDKSYLYRLKDFDNKFADKKIDDKPIEQESYGKRHYFVRPKSLTLGFGFEQYKIVFTTTELLVSSLVIRQFGDGVDQPTLMPEEKLIAGQIHMMKTKYVSSKRDGLLPPMVERVKRMTGKYVEYFADGQGCNFNLVNNKGQNIFVGQNSIIEISEPHLEAVINLQHELNWNDDDHNVLKFLIAFDMMNQTIGRTCGYRYSDRLKNVEDVEDTVTVVLCAPRLFKALVEHSRYYLAIPVDLDKKMGDGRRWKLNEDDEKSIVKTVSWLIQNYQRYAVDGVGSCRPGQDWMSDIHRCLDSVNTQAKRSQRRKRLLDAMIKMEEACGFERYKIVIQRCINTVSSL